MNILWYILLWPLVLIDRVYHRALFAIAKRQHFDTFTLYSVENDPKFFDQAIAALQLLRAVDPRRYRRVQRYMPIIAHVRQGANFYKHAARAFYVNACPDDAADFASEVVHEATHAYLAHRGIRYTKKNRERHERLCTTEQLAFVTRAIQAQTHVPVPQQQALIAQWRHWFEEHLASKWWEDHHTRHWQFAALKTMTQELLSSLKWKKR